VTFSSVWQIMGLGIKNGGVPFWFPLYDHSKSKIINGSNVPFQFNLYILKRTCIGGIHMHPKAFTGTNLAQILDGLNATGVCGANRDNQHKGDEAIGPVFLNQNSIKKIILAFHNFTFIAPSRTSGLSV
jgi:hypothetical protein